MPTKTFYNLPEKKKKRIIDAALDEFSSHFYHKASVNRIVESAEISKGSFYQYFDDKKDLYKYIIENLGQKKMEYLKQIIANKEEYNFFEILEKLYETAIKFAKDHPRFDKIGYKLYTNTDSEIFDEIIKNSKEKSITFFEDLLKKGIKEGEVDEKIDLNLAAHIMTNTSISLGKLFYRDGKIDEEDMELVKKMLYIFKNGLKKDK
ncbi:MAG: TetR/AcrR family transcriptional regulator [Bacillota bacterium]